MYGLRISIITATSVVLLLVLFGLYQYFLLGNENVLKGPGNSGFQFILLFLVLVFSFLVGLISFIPALTSIYTASTIAGRLAPILISTFFILVSLGLVFKVIVPELEVVK